MPGPSDEPHVTPATATETSALMHTGPPVPFDAKHHVLSRFNGVLVIVVWVAVIGALCFLSTTTLRKENPGNSLGVIVNNDNDRPFPSDFVWGVATSAYQIEGAVTEDGRGVTIWDTFVLVPGAVADNSTGVTADDHYHRWKDDVALMKSLHVTAYRFSIAWSRILPTGRGTINAAGIRFYETLIDELLANDIEPWITLFHWDLPQSLQDDFGGWLDHRTVDAFADYARVVFQSFCPKVKRFITLNEPWTYAVNGHGSGIHAPGRSQHPTTEPYIVAHNFLLAHAKVSKIYKGEYACKDGMIGISNCGDFRYPKSASSKRDQEAAERAMLFQWGWFVEPLVFGRYPPVMRERLGDRLPQFTLAEQDALRGSADFLGLNYYSAFLASTPNNEASYGGYWADIHVDFSDDPRWDHNAMGWNVVPVGLREMLLWISKRYGEPLIYITENGSAESDLEPSLHEEKRRLFFEGHIRASAEAIRDGVNLSGYFAWSLMDNFEWQFGYQRRFGLCRVDYDTLERTPRDAATWYRDTVRSNGRNIRFGQAAGSSVSVHNTPGNHRVLNEITPSVPWSRSLPDKVLIGYGSDCDAVRRAIYDGVNIVIWSFLDITVSHSKQTAFLDRRLDEKTMNDFSKQRRGAVSTNLNLTAIRLLIEELDEAGLNVLHLASVGGWNGAHLNAKITAHEWYLAFQESVGDIFDGIDWDLEGNDQMSSTYNFFTLECLHKVGEISRLAKEDGRFVSMAPPQSYLDIGTEKFSRYVNLTVADREWHGEFSYFGANVYAFILQKYGQYVDLISIQFYESYSRAAQAVYHDGMAASDYLIRFVHTLVSNQETMYVDFSDDPDVGILGQNVSLPMQKLVFGLGNGWTSVGDHSGDEKALYIAPAQLESTWRTLGKINSLPRGFMFWTINLEGMNGIYLARDLSRILQIAP